MTCVPNIFYGQSQASLSSLFPCCGRKIPQFYWAWSYTQGVWCLYVENDKSLHPNSYVAQCVAKFTFVWIQMRKAPQVLFLELHFFLFNFCCKMFVAASHSHLTQDLLYLSRTTRVFTATWVEFPVLWRSTFQATYQSPDWQIIHSVCLVDFFFRFIIHYMVGLQIFCGDGDGDGTLYVKFNSGSSVLVLSKL